MKSLILVVAGTTLLTSSYLFGATVFFSTIGFGGGATLGNPDLTVDPSDAPFDLHIYFITDAGDASYLGISLGVASTTSGVVDITGFSVLNPDILVGAVPVDERWNATGGSLVSSQEISNMSGVSVDKAGLDPANDGSGVFVDAGFDATASAFYFGVVTIDPVGEGTTTLNFSVGTAGIARSGDVPRPVGPTAPLTFGAGEPTTVFGDDFGATGSAFDARIVVPEPSAALLVWMGAFLGLLRRRRSRS